MSSMSVDLNILKGDSLPQLLQCSKNSIQKVNVGNAASNDTINCLVDNADYTLLEELIENLRRLVSYAHLELGIDLTSVLSGFGRSLGCSSTLNRTKRVSSPFDSVFNSLSWTKT